MADATVEPSEPRPTILAFESSCDETACAVVRGNEVLSSIVASQIEVHAPFGGVVPELASRHHLDVITDVYERALAASGLDLDAVDAVAVTDSPGLVGALLVGVQAARGVALAADLPLHGVHHMEGHLFSPLLGAEEEARGLPAHLALLVSGGHTELVDVQGLGRYRRLGTTRDDAVGEAFDKVAKMLGLGYPGGPVIDRLAADGNPAAINFPRAMIDQPNLDFSFAGLKTAVLVHLEREGQPESKAELSDLCASFQAAVVDVLVAKTLRARRETGHGRVHVVGGAAANSGLRAALQDAAEAEGFSYGTAPLRYCGDNAAMIGAAAAARHAASNRRSVDVSSTLALDDPHARLRL